MHRHPSCRSCEALSTAVAFCGEGRENALTLRERHHVEAVRLLCGIQRLGDTATG